MLGLETERSGHCTRDLFEVRCELTLMGEPVTSKCLREVWTRSLERRQEQTAPARSLKNRSFSKKIALFQKTGF